MATGTFNQNFLHEKILESLITARVYVNCAEEFRIYDFFTRTVEKMRDSCAFVIQC